MLDNSVSSNAQADGHQFLCNNGIEQFLQWQRSVLDEDESDVITDVMPSDILLGRGRRHVHRPANKRLQAIVDEHRDEYFATESAMKKNSILDRLVDRIEGRFLRRNQANTGWLALGSEDTRLRIAQTLQYQQRIAKKRGQRTTTRLLTAARSTTCTPPQAKAKCSATEDVPGATNIAIEAEDASQVKPALSLHAKVAPSVSFAANDRPKVLVDAGTRCKSYPTIMSVYKQAMELRLLQLRQERECLLKARAVVDSSSTHALMSQPRVNSHSSAWQLLCCRPETDTMFSMKDHPAWLATENAPDFARADVIFDVLFGSESLSMDETNSAEIAPPIKDQEPRDAPSPTSVIIPSADSVFNSIPTATVDQISDCDSNSSMECTDDVMQSLYTEPLIECPTSRMESLE